MFTAAMMGMPASAIDLTVETWIPDYLLTDELNLTGTVEGTYQRVSYDSKEEWDTGTYDNLTVDDVGRLWLYPDFNIKMQNGGKAVLTGGTGWDKLLTSKHVLKHNGTYYLYYTGRPSASGAPQIGLATSTDGENYTKFTGNPVVKAGPGAYDRSGVMQPVVLLDKGTWRMWYAGMPSPSGSLVCYATSSDGTNWTKYSGNPTIPKSLNIDLWDGTRIQPVGVLKENDTLYRLYYEGEGNNSDWKMGMATSTNCTNWQHYGGNPIRTPMDNNWEESTANFQCVEKSSDSYRLWIYGGKDERSLGYTWGTNGISWPRSVGPVMSPTSGTIYSDNLLGPTVIDEGDHYYMIMGCDDGSKTTFGAWRQYPQKMNGTFTSRVHTLAATARIAEIDWDEGLPAGGYLDIYLRWGNQSTTLTDWRLVEYDQRMLNVTAKHFQFKAIYRAPEDWFRIGLLHFDVKVQATITDVRVRVGGGPWEEAEVDFNLWYANLTLPDGDHIVTVNATDAFDHTIEKVIPVKVDLYPPEGTIVLEAGSPYTRSTGINYSLMANDTHGVPYCMVSMLYDFIDTTWQPFFGNATWEYRGLDGNVRLYARFKDGAGRVSETVFDDIFVDTAPPRAWMVINGGAKYTNSTSLRVRVKWDDLSGVVQANASEAPDLKGGRDLFPEGSSVPKQFDFDMTIAPGDGARTVYVLLRDASGWEVVISDSIILDTTPPAASFVINGDKPYCTVLEVLLNVSIHDANPVSIRWANDEGGWLTDWKTFGSSDAVPWTLSAGPDGGRSVRLLVKDMAGNEIEEVDDIVMDSTPPEGTLTINGGDMLTSIPLVTCQLNVTDITSGVHQIRVSNQRQLLEDTPWQDPRETFEWLLEHGDGTRTVFVDVMDLAGLVTSLHATILLDSTPQEGQMEIDAGREFSMGREVVITFNVKDVEPGVDVMRVSGTPDFTDSEWTYFQVQLPWTLSSGDGVKTVYAEIIDSAGHSAILIDSIILDTLVPSGGMLINDGDRFTFSREVKVDLWAEDETTGIAGMMVSEDPTFQGLEWRSFSSFMQWDLTEGDGIKVLYLALRDLAGWEVVVSERIILDTTPPKGEMLITSNLHYTNTSEVQVTVLVTDEGSGMAGMYILDDPTMDPMTLVPYIDTLDWTLTDGDGPKTLRIRVVDNVGNEAMFEVHIILDTVPPEITFDHPTLLKATRSRLEIVPVVTDELDPDPSISYRIDGGEWDSIPDGPFHVRLSDPNHIVQVRAVDGAGNVAIEEVEIEYTPEFDLTAGLTLLVVLVVMVVVIMVAIYVKRRDDRTE